MNRLVMISILAAMLLAPLTVQADHRKHAEYDRHGARQHYVHNFDRHGHRHKPYARVTHRGKYYAHPHHRGRKYGHYKRPWRHDDGGHWGIVIRYFE
jgi:Ni/Co efflux regulator RcnB